MSRPELLHNMSSRPRTPVAIHVEPIDEYLTSFSLEGLTAALNRVVPGRTRATLRLSLAEFVCKGDVAELSTILEHAWDPLGLRGAVLLYAGPSGVCYPPVQPCRDPLIVLNVLARARGNVLLPDAPLVLQPRSLDRCVMTDDPRLADLVAGGRDRT